MAVTSPPVDPVLKTNGINQLVLAVVWLTIASGAIVFTEPAPIDLMSMGLVLALPIVGLVRFRNGLFLLFAAFCILGAAGLIAATLAPQFATAAKHAGISVYLYATAIVLSGFVALRAYSHSRLILGASLVAGVLTATAGVVGYADLWYVTTDAFVRHSRAAGTFKDPNVFASFLILPLILSIHLVVTGSALKKAVGLMSGAILLLAIFLSFSRGAWAGLAIAGLCYAFLAFTTARTHRERLTMTLMLIVAFAAGLFLLSALLQNPDVADFFIQRAQLFQSYDDGPTGRFAGQLKALGVITENPLGIGGLQFAPRLHPEDPHNVFISMFLNAGWLGGLIFLVVVAATLIFGLQHALRRTAHQGLFLVAFSAFLGLITLGFLVDIDHWRHFYLNAALIWGMMASYRRPTRILVSGHRMHASAPSDQTRQDSPSERITSAIAASKALNADAERRSAIDRGALHTLELDHAAQRSANTARRIAIDLDGLAKRNVSRERRRTILGPAKRRLRGDLALPRRHRAWPPRRPGRITYRFAFAGQA